MNVSAAIIGLLDKVRTGTLKHFNVLDTYIYDETLDFRGRASQWLAREGIFQNIEGETPDDWIFIIWNRSSLQPSNYNNRPLKATMNSVDPLSTVDADSTLTLRMASLDIDFKIVTNNMSLAEQIEEHLYVNTGEFLKFTADYGEIGIVNCSAQPTTTTTFEKEDLSELGPVIGVGISININFPVIMPKELVHRIEIINNKLWEGTTNELLSSEVIS